MRDQAILAAKQHDYKKLRASLESGVSVDACDDDGFSLFQLYMRFPCRYGDDDCCNDLAVWNLFLEYNASFQGSVDRESEPYYSGYSLDLDSVSYKNMSAIHWAYLIRGEQSPEFNFLVDHNATDLNARCEQAAEQEGEQELYFSEASLGGATWTRRYNKGYALEDATVLHFAIARGDLDTVNRLLGTKKVDVQQPLMLVYNKHLVNEDTCCDKYSYGFDPEIDDSDEDIAESDHSNHVPISYQFLHLKTVDLVTLFVARDYNGVYAERYRNVTALHLAAMAMKTDIGKALLQAGALLDARDSERLTPANYYQQRLIQSGMESKKTIRNYEWLVGEETRKRMPSPNIIPISALVNVGDEKKQSEDENNLQKKSFSVSAFEELIASNVSSAPVTAAQHAAICDLFGIADKETRRLIRETERQLLLGEAGMLFTLAYLLKYYPDNANVGHSLIATEYQSYHELKEQEGAAFVCRLQLLLYFGVRVFFGVDATRLTLYRSLGLFTEPHVMRFNCPHDRGDIHKQTLPRMLETFFWEASRIQWENDIVLVTLPHPPELETRRHRQAYIYGIYQASANAGYVLTEIRPFDNEYPGYEHRKTGDSTSAGVAESCAEFIFRKSSLSPSDIWWHPLYGPGGIHFKRGREFYYLPELAIMPSVQPDLKSIDDSVMLNEVRSLETQALIDQLVASVKIILASPFVSEISASLAKMIVITRLLIANSCLTNADVGQLRKQYQRIEPVCEQVAQYPHYPRFRALYFESRKLHNEIEEYCMENDEAFNRTIPMRRFA